jgi:hypothetical protein
VAVVFISLYCSFENNPHLSRSSFHFSPDELINVMFSPSTGLKTDKKEWNKLATRNVYFQCLEYLSQIKKAQDIHIEQAGIPIQEKSFSVATFKRILVTLFCRQRYGGLPKDYNDGNPDLGSLAIVWHTKPTTPTCAIGIARTVKIDFNNLLSGRIDTDIAPEPNENPYLEMIVMVHPLSKDHFHNNKSFVSVFFAQNATESHNIMTMVLLRAYLCTIVQKCNQGRKLADCGAVKVIELMVMDQKIYGPFRLGMLYDDKDKVHLAIKNMTNRFHVTCMKKRQDLLLSNDVLNDMINGTNGNYKNLLKSLCNDIDSDKFTQLVKYALHHPNTEPPIHVQMELPLITPINLGSDNNSASTKIDQQLLICNDYPKWKNILSLAGDNGCITESLLRTITNLRIKWQSKCWDIMQSVVTEGQLTLPNCLVLNTFLRDGHYNCMEDKFVE